MSVQEMDTRVTQRVIVAVCTHKRNDELRRLLLAVVRNARVLPAASAVGVVVVDDNADGRACTVVDEFEGCFPLGIRYLHCGTGNISIARNAAIDEAFGDSDWVAMTDDDCEPVDAWLTTYVDAASQGDFDILTGPCEHQVPKGSPGWLEAQPIFEDLRFEFPDGAIMTVAATNNSFMRTEFFLTHPELRFDEELGRIGGEDMVFFRQAVRAGASIRFCTDAIVLAHESSARATLSYQLHSRFWLGNTSFVTHKVLGDAPPLRWLLWGCNMAVVALLRPAQRIVRRKPPQFRYTFLVVAQALGVLSGAAGVRIRHH